MENFKNSANYKKREKLRKEIEKLNAPIHKDWFNNFSINKCQRLYAHLIVEILNLFAYEQYKVDIKISNKTIKVTGLKTKYETTYFSKLDADKITKQIIFTFAENDCDIYEYKIKDECHLDTAPYYEFTLLNMDN